MLAPAAHQQHPDLAEELQGLRPLLQQPEVEAEVEVVVLPVEVEVGVGVGVGVRLLLGLRWRRLVGPVKQPVPALRCGLLLIPTVSLESLDPCYS